MMKLHLIYLTLCSLSHAAYISRMAVNRIASHRPTAFRPGVMLQRPWPTRLMHAASSHRAPYVIYRNVPQRYAMKHFNPSRNVYSGGHGASGSWKTTIRQTPHASVTPSEYEFVRAASSPPAQHTDGGAIHTIPAPNLSLSERPIVVIEAENVVGNSNTATSEASKQAYDVTEKYPDQSIYQMAKIEQPIGFSKATSLTSPEFQALVRNGAALQLASDLGISAIALPQHSVVQQQIVPQQQIVHQQQIVPQQQIVHQQHIVPQQQIVAQQSIVPQQFTLQGFNGVNAQDLIQAGPEGIVISPNALYQPDPSFMQKLTNQLLQRFPGVEFIPYATEFQQQPFQPQTQQIQPQIPQEPQLFLLENEQITKQTPSSFVASENQKNIAQRETEEGTVVTLVPQELVVSNVTENHIEVTSPSQPHNVTIELVPAESQPATTTVKYVVETSTEEQKTTPIYYAQVGQSVGNVIANGFFSAINDVRAAAALAQVEKPQESTKPQENVTTTTINPEFKAYFVQKPEKDEKNETTVTELKPLLGVPFAKKPEPVKVAYTLLRTDEKAAKVAKDGSVYAGQIVEATISEDHDFNKEKATLLSRRAPIRLFAVTEKKGSSTTNSPQRVTVVKAKIPPKSKLTFDDKTGEPVLRIYASYVDNAAQKELNAAKLANMRHVKAEVARKQDTVDNWKSATVKAVDKTQGFDRNQVTQFGLKLRARSDDYIPLFEDYEE